METKDKFMKKARGGVIGAKLEELEVDPAQLESLAITRAFIKGFYILLFTAVAVLASPIVSDYYWSSKVQFSGLTAILNWLMVPLGTIMGALLTKWKGARKQDQDKKKDDESDIA